MRLAINCAYRIKFGFAHRPSTGEGYLGVGSEALVIERKNKQRLNMCLTLLVNVTDVILLVFIDHSFGRVQLLEHLHRF